MLPMLVSVAQTTGHDPVLVWNEVALEAIRTARTAPPPASRNLAILHAALYDAVNAVTRTHTPYLVDAHPPQGTSAEAAASAAAFRILCALYPAQVQRFSATLQQ